MAIAQTLGYCTTDAEGATSTMFADAYDEFLEALDDARPPHLQTFRPPQARHVPSLAVLRPKSGVSTELP